VIFAFVEDGTLEIYETAPEAVRNYEGIDVESGTVRFYDENGVYLEPRFGTPNRRGKLFGLFGWVSSGVYDLVANPGASEDLFALALHETASLAPNRWFASLEQLKSALAARGIEVELRSRS
jgi:hypothetical protein